MLGFLKKRNIYNEIYSNIVSYMDEAVVVLDAKYNIMFCNNSVQKIFGHEAKDIVGKKISFLLPNRVYHSNERMIEDFARSKVKLISMLQKKVQIYGHHRDGRDFIASVALVNASIDSDEYYGVIIRDISENKKNEEELLRLASTDPLTGVLNRREFRAIAEKEVMRSKRYGRPLSLLIMDIDHFKVINDSYGHAAGDKALQHLTKLCSSSLRTMDVICRWGGEEFVIMLPETGMKGAVVIAERLRSSIEETDFINNNNKIDFTVSVGVSAFKQGDDDIDGVLSRADSSLYMAKENGRNKVVASE